MDPSEMWWHYKARWFKIKDPFSTKRLAKGEPRMEPFEIMVWPPIFLDFLDLDPDSYESFRVFVERFGLDWFSEFDGEEDTNLKVTLDKYWKKKASFIFPSYLENCLKRMEQKIKKEQQLLKMVWDVFEEYKPLSPLEYPDRNPELDSVLGINFEKRKSLELRPDVVTLFKKGKKTKTKIIERPPDRGSSLIAICHFEAWLAFSNKWWAKKCKLCRGRFFSSKENEYYCNRIAPSKFWKQIPKTFKEEDFQKLTCKKLGPQVTFNETLQKNEKMRAYREEYLKRAAKISYLKRKGKPYETYLKDFETWKIKEGRKNGNHN